MERRIELTTAAAIEFGIWTTRLLFGHCSTEGRIVIDIFVGLSPCDRVRVVKDVLVIVLFFFD